MKSLITLRSAFRRILLATSAVTALLAAEPTPAPKTEAAKEEPSSAEALTEALKKLQLPGITINPKERFVDVQSIICLDDGSLELIACTKGSKEHESVIMVEASPVHIHTALLLLGAKNGNPAMRKPLNEELTRWQDFPPSGDPIDVFLAWKNEKGEEIERPISDFIMRSKANEYTPAPEPDKDKEKFPHTFLFAGSQLGPASDTPRKYAADYSGHVISISAFGDEVLCLPEVYSQENGSLMWQIDSTHLPKLHSKVSLRLRVKKIQP